MTFDTLGLNPAILRSVTESGYTTPTEVQGRSIPAALTGVDLRVCSNTGSGKTAAFVLPALQKILEARAAEHAARVAAAEAAGEPAPTEEACPAERAPESNSFDPRRGRNKPRFGPRNRDTQVSREIERKPSGPRVLVLAPTRELAMQVAKAVDTYGRYVPGLRVATAVGGMPYPVQIKALRGSLDILIATPGRLIDHLGSGTARLGEVEMLILDEADRMLDMGFIEDIQHIAEQIPAQRQTVMVSATFAGSVGRLAQQLQKPDAQRIDVSSHTDTHDNISQQLLWADDLEHKDALLQQLLSSADLQQAVVFTSTQRDADLVAERLYGLGHAVAPLHGGMAQGMRNRTLMALRRGELRVLVATDVAARGIDVPTISHVINYGLPMKAEDYVHRIGRTGRAGRSGQAVTLAERHDAPMLRRIQHFTTQQLPVSTLEGLEPKRVVPRLDSRPEGRGGFGAGRPGGRPGFGGRPGYGGRGGFGGDRPERGGEFRHGGPRPEGRPEFRGEPPRGDFRGGPRNDFRAGEGRPEFRGEPPRGEFRGHGPSHGHAGRPDQGAPHHDSRGYRGNEQRTHAPHGGDGFRADTRGHGPRGEGGRDSRDGGAPQRRNPRFSDR